MTWLDPERLHPVDVAGVAALLAAADAVDAPHELGPTVRTVAADLRHGSDGHPPAAAVTRDEHGRVVGLLQVDLPRWDNPHLGSVSVTVDPTARRQGLGRALLDAGLDRVRGAGRRLAVADCFDRSAGPAFLRALGFERAYEEVQRRQDLVGLDRKRLEEEHREAEARAGAYELLRLPGPIPDELLGELARLSEAINDAPTESLDIEDEAFPPERLRGFERALCSHGRRLYRVVARERATGALAGHTVVVVDGERPWHGWQNDTSVLRAHRGHRLGLLLKTSMLGWLAEREPQLRTVDTWNAASNEHMIRVNEVLGYQVVATGAGWQRRL